MKGRSFILLLIVIGGLELSHPINQTRYYFAIALFKLFIADISIFDRIMQDGGNNGITI